MKRYGFGVMLAFAALSAMGQEASSDAAKATVPPQAQKLSAEEEDRLAQLPAHPAGTFSSSAQAAQSGGQPGAQSGTPQAAVQASDGLPQGVVTEANPMKAAYLAKRGAQPAFFRPNPSMPEIVNEDLLRGYVESGKATARSARNFIGYMPKLTVLPCPVGCNGEAYDKAVAAFIDGYEGDQKQLFQHRGELIVQVRWFHARPWYQHAVPYGTDSFGVEFMLEGKVVSIGKQSVVAGQHTKNAAELAHDVGANIGAELAFTLGLGAKPSYLDAANDVGKGFAGSVGKVSDALGSVFGADGVRSSIEPATEANSNLLPAIDGIQPNEIAPITSLHYIYGLML